MKEVGGLINKKKCKYLLFAGRIDCNESIFYYRAGEDCSMYQNTSFTPMFLEDFNSTRLAEANKTCKGERGCLFDFLITGNQAIADNSKRVMDIEVQRQLEAGTELYIPGL